MISKTVLDNGIRVISEKLPHALSVSVGIWVANGSRHERRESNGVAHFIEHLLFKGTDSRSALDIAREIDSVGGVLNAFTGREYVCYYAKVLDRYLPRAVDLLADIFLNSTFAADEIEKERKVILQEINLLEDTPDDFISNLFFQNFWKDHPLGRPIIGNTRSVENLSRDFIVTYKNDTYHSGDVIITVAGNMEHDELLRLLRDKFERIVPSSTDCLDTAPVQLSGFELVEKDLEQVHLCLGVQGVSQTDERRYEAYLLNAILGGSMSSRLFQEVREKKGLAYSIYSYMASYADAGSLTVYAGTSQEHLDELLDITFNEMKKLKSDVVSPAELESAKEQIKGNIMLSLESSDNRMSKLAKNEIYYGGYQSLDAIMEGVDRVTSESLNRVCNDLFHEESVTLVMMGRVSGRHVGGLSL